MTRTYPKLWKMALVCPLLKNKSPTEPNDYRPISILPCFSKALEHIIHKQLTHYLYLHDLLDPYQSGFKKNHSTTMALLSVTEDYRQKSTHSISSSRL